MSSHDWTKARVLEDLGFTRVEFPKTMHDALRKVGGKHLRDIDLKPYANEYLEFAKQKAFTQAIYSRLSLSFLSTVGMSASISAIY